jgi:hypothetical protein
MIFRVRMPFPEIPDQPIALTPSALSNAFMALDQSLEKILESTILSGGHRGLENFQMDTTNMPQQYAARLRIVLALDVALKDFDHPRREVHESFAAGILPGI